MNPVGQFRIAGALALGLLGSRPGEAQGPNPLQPAAYSFVLDLAGTPLGEIPAAIKLTKGLMEMVMKDGQPMLKATASSEFTILLPQPLPQVFTLEFEIVPKACCNPQDLSFEGTPTINQGAGSAHVMWDSDGYLAIVGGGQTYEAPMPEDLRTTLPGVLTSVVAVIQGPTIKLYTNGRRHYTLDRTFARGRVLRVFLGGQDDGPNAVHLAGLRILAGAATPAGIAAIPTPPPGQPSAAPPGQPAAPAPPPAPAPPAPPPQAPPPPAPSPSSASPSGTPPMGARPVTTPVSTGRSSARCTPGTVQGAPPLNYRGGGGRVGGAVLDWWVEANAEYLVERSPDPGDGSRSWTRLTSTCDFPSGLRHFSFLHEDGNTYPGIGMVDVYPGVKLGTAYAYRVTVIRADGTSGSSEISHTTSGGQFLSSPIAAVNGNVVRLAADVSYCTGLTPPIRCDPWMMEFLVTSSSSGFSHSSRQPWVNSYDPNLPLSVPGGVEGTFAFTISGVPSGTHTFTLTALYQPDHRVNAGSVTVVVP